MVILSKSTIRHYGDKYPAASSALNDWYDKTLAANWSSLADIKTTFNHVDYIANNRYVFNIKGNHYRLIAKVMLPIRTVYIKFVGTHAEYDRIDILTVEPSRL
ncbi:MAG: type II toxin-antitoxin system HigB family toxin [Hymenobacter sp.]|nr:MAG: type II toxin-antitoxin system HigB family toxin [Hymenobacter sp.]